MILSPNLIISVTASEDDKRHSILVRLEDTKVQNSMHHDLGHVEREGFHALCQSVGYSTVYALARAHPDVFNKYPLLLPPPLPQHDPHQLAILLLYHAGRDETGAYTKALDNLFQRFPEELAGLADSWAMLRETLPPA